MVRTKQVKQSLRGLWSTQEIIRDNPGSIIHHSELPRIWERYGFPSEWRVETPDMHQVNCLPLFLKNHLQFTSIPYN